MFALVTPSMLIPTLKSVFRIVMSLASPPMLGLPPSRSMRRPQDCVKLVRPPSSVNPGRVGREVDPHAAASRRLCRTDRHRLVDAVPDPVVARRQADGLACARRGQLRVERRRRRLAVTVDRDRRRLGRSRGRRAGRRGRRSGRSGARTRVAGGIAWVRPGADLVAVAGAVTVGVGAARIGPVALDLGAVAEAVAVGVGAARVGAQPVLAPVGQPVAVGVALGRGLRGREVVAPLPAVREPVVVTVA